MRLGSPNNISKLLLILLSILAIGCSGGKKERKVSSKMYYEHYANKENYRVTESHSLFTGEYFSVQDSIWNKIYEMGTSDKRFIDHIVAEMLEEGVEEHKEYQEAMEYAEAEAAAESTIY